MSKRLCWKSSCATREDGAVGRGRRIAHDFNNLLTAIIGYTKSCCTRSIQETPGVPTPKRSPVPPCVPPTHQTDAAFTGASAAAQVIDLNIALRKVEPMLRRDRRRHRHDRKGKRTSVRASGPWSDGTVVMTWCERAR